LEWFPGHSPEQQTQASKGDTGKAFTISGHSLEQQTQAAKGRYIYRPSAASRPFHSHQLSQKPTLQHQQLSDPQTFLYIYITTPSFLPATNRKMPYYPQSSFMHTELFAPEIVAGMVNDTTQSTSDHYGSRILLVMGSSFNADTTHRHHHKRQDQHRQLRGS
jgi:hypothetical protein